MKIFKIVLTILCLTSISFANEKVENIDNLLNLDTPVIKTFSK